MARLLMAAIGALAAEWKDIPIVVIGRDGGISRKWNTNADPYAEDDAVLRAIERDVQTPFLNVRSFKCIVNNAIYYVCAEPLFLGNGSIEGVVAMFSEEPLDEASAAALRLVCKVINTMA